MSKQTRTKIPEGVNKVRNAVTGEVKTMSNQTKGVDGVGGMHEKAQELLMMFIDDAYTGKNSKKKAFKMMAFVANDQELQNLVNSGNSKNILEYRLATTDSALERVRAEVQILIDSIDPEEAKYEIASNGYWRGLIGALEIIDTELARERES